MKAAEADSESKYLTGVGVARERRALMDGLRDSVNGFSSVIKGTTPKDVMDLLLLTQYFDMLRDVGSKPGEGRALLLPHGPQSVGELRASLEKTMFAHTA